VTQISDPQQQQHRKQVRVAASLAVGAAVSVAAVIVGVTLLTGGADESPAGSGVLFSPPAPLSDASTVCGAGTLADDDHTLVIDMAGEEPGVGTATIDDVLCVLGELKSPQSVIARMESTRALDGMQSATWDDFEVTWTYHPDDGLDLIVTHKA
jgi:hypothetical protein